MAQAEPLAAAAWSDTALAPELALKPVQGGEDDTRQFGVRSKEDTGDRHYLATKSGAPEIEYPDAPRRRRRLLQGNLAHELRAEDFAQLDTLGRRCDLLIRRALDFSGDRIEFLACVIEGRHVLLFDHQQDVEIM